MTLVAMKIGGLLLVVFFTLAACHDEQREYEARVKMAKITEGIYTRFPVNNFKHLKLNCEVGRVRVKVYQQNQPMIEVHESFQKYVNFEERGDSLIVYTTKSPFSTKEKQIKKSIKFYVPDLDSYEAEVTQTSFLNFRTKKLDVKLYNDYFRLFNCGIADFKVITKDICNVQISRQNIIFKAEMTINEDSYLVFKAPVKELILNKKTLEHVNLRPASSKNLTWVK